MDKIYCYELLENKKIYDLAYLMKNKSMSRFETEFFYIKIRYSLHQGWPLRGPRPACDPQHLFKENQSSFLKILREFVRQYFD